MTNLPRLELTEDPNKNNDFIIFRHSINSTKIKDTKITNAKTVTKKRRKHSTKKRKSRKSTRKGFFNIFS
jgi:hypothetical protein